MSGEGLQREAVCRAAQSAGWEETAASPGTAPLKSLPGNIYTAHLMGTRYSQGWLWINVF